MALEPDQDRALVRRLAAGDEAAYGELYDRCGPAMLRGAAAMLGSADDAQDAVQEVFLAVARTGRPLAAVENLRAYLFAALRRQCGRQRVRRGRAAAATSAPARPQPAAPNPGDADPAGGQRVVQRNRVA